MGWFAEGKVWVHQKLGNEDGMVSSESTGSTASSSQSANVQRRDRNNQDVERLRMPLEYILAPKDVNGMGGFHGFFDEPAAEWSMCRTCAMTAEHSWRWESRRILSQVEGMGPAHWCGSCGVTCWLPVAPSRPERVKAGKDVYRALGGRSAGDYISYLMHEFRATRRLSQKAFSSVLRF